MRNPRQPQTKLERSNPEYLFKSGIAGGIAGCVAKTVVGPLDRVKILFQTNNPDFIKYTGSWAGLPSAMRDIYTHTGLRGLFKGHSATLLRIFPYAGIQFLAYEQIRARIITSNTQETHVRRFLSGSLAGLTAAFFVYPMELVRVRLAFETQQQQRSTIRSICRKIYNEHPLSSIRHASESGSAVASAVLAPVTPRHSLAGFFRGFTPTLLGMVPYAGASFLTHDVMSDLMRHPLLTPYTTHPPAEPFEAAWPSQEPAQLRYWAQLGTGGFAGFVSQTLSYPLEVIRRRMQVGGAVGDGHRLGIAETARKIFMESGWRGFYVGLTIGYIKAVPLTATSFYVYKRGKYYLGI